MPCRRTSPDRRCRWALTPPNGPAKPGQPEVIISLLSVPSSGSSPTQHRDSHWLRPETEPEYVLSTCLVGFVVGVEVR